MTAQTATKSKTTAATPDVMAIARQPIVDAKHAIFGYELFDRSHQNQDYSAASDAALLFNLLSNADSEVLNGRNVMFINCTHQTLSGSHLTLIEPENVVLEVPALPDHQADAEDIDTYRQTLDAVHKRGFRLAFDASVLEPAYANWLSFASFIKVDLTRLNADQLATLVHRTKQATSAQLVAEKVETAEQFELAKRLGCRLFQGYWFAKPVLIHGQAVRPAQAAIIELINLVRKQASTAELEEVFKRDATLSYNLLRFINSAGFGLSCEVTSFRHAVMLLGLKKLFRWAALLMTTSQASGGSPAVGHVAIVRGRLMELLAAEMLPQEECDNAFVVGIFSLLDTMIGQPLAQVLATISLPQSVTDALLHGTGLLGPLLKLTLACEQVDDAAFADLTTELQLTSHQVNWAHLQALAWAETITK